MSRVRTGAVAMAVVAVAAGAFAVGRFTAPRPPAAERVEVPNVAPVAVAEPPTVPRMPAPTPPSGVAGVWTYRVVHSRHLQAAMESVPPGFPRPQVPPLPPFVVQPLCVLHIHDATNTRVATTTTDAAGRFRVPLPPGQYWFLGDRPGSLGSYAFEVRPGEYTARDFAEGVVAP